MVSVGRVEPGAAIGVARAPRQSATPAAPPAQRALVLVNPGDQGKVAPTRAADGRAVAPFLAHLIATAQGDPQTRERRRADPNRAITAYAAAMGVPKSVGPMLRAIR